MTSSSRCEEQIKLAQTRSMSPMAATLRVQPSAPPHEMQCVLALPCITAAGVPDCCTNA